MSDPFVLQSAEDRVGILTLNRPDRLNAITGEGIEELVVALERMAADPEIRAVVLTGAGRGFCAGGDLKSMAGPRSDDDATAARPTEADFVANFLGLTRAVELLHEIPKVTIAAVNGACAGAGLSLACAADLRIAVTSAVFTTAFAAAGQTGDYGLAWTLPRLVGSTRARDLMFLPERFDAAEALRIGLVSRVVADDALAAAVALGCEIAARAPLAIAGMKANLNDAERLELPQLLEREARRFYANQATDDAREGARAFAEGRPPNFLGK
jgi:2-(1,2-epoxy-1,2-dihydrophenyl)acetyl-CoA isomerase